MAWYVRFIPDECDSISILLNGENWTKWYRSSGDQKVIVPQRFRDLDRIKVGATVSPEGRNGKIWVYWDGNVRQEFDFDNYEDHDIDRE